MPVTLFGQPNQALNVFAGGPIRAHNMDGTGVLIVHRPRPTTDAGAAFRVIRYFRGGTGERDFRTSTHPLSVYETDRLVAIMTPDAMQWVWLNRELEVEGSVRIPREMSVYDINQGRMLIRMDNEWDVPSLCVYAVDRLSPEDAPEASRTDHPGVCPPVLGAGT